MMSYGIPAEGRKKIAAALSAVLADTYTLYLKTHNFHWNVTGPQFNALHNMFEEEYNELALAVDEIAERIRSLGEFAPGSYSAFAKLASVQEANDTPDATTMTKTLADDQGRVAATAQKALAVAQEYDDEVTIGMMVDRMTVHEKAAWMLNSMVAA